MKTRSIRCFWYSLLLLWLAPTTARSEIIVATDAIVNLFDGDRDAAASGVQITTPVVLRYQTPQWTVTLQSSYTSLAVDRPKRGDEAEAQIQASEQDITALTDVALALAYRPERQLAGIKAALSLNLNLPGGKERLSQQEYALFEGVNKDVLTVDTFGEGFNVSGSLQLIKPLPSRLIGFSAGYVSRGKYDATTDVPRDECDPGDRVMLNAVMQQKLSPAWLLSSALDYVHEGAEQVGGQDHSQQGDSWTVSGALTHARPRVKLGVTVRYNITGSSRELVNGALRREADNSSGPSLTTALALAYQAVPTLKLLASASVTQGWESARQDADSGLPYEGGSRRYDVAAGLQYRPGRRWLLTLEAGGARLEQDADRSLAEDAASWSIAPQLGVAYTF